MWCADCHSSGTCSQSKYMLSRPETWKRTGDRRGHDSLVIIWSSLTPLFCGPQGNMLLSDFGLSQFVENNSRERLKSVVGKVLMKVAEQLTRASTRNAWVCCSWSCPETWPWHRGDLRPKVFTACTNNLHCPGWFLGIRCAAVWNGAWFGTNTIQLWTQSAAERHLEKNNIRRAKHPSKHIASAGWASTRLFPAP